jgi:hypothetical protein
VGSSDGLDAITKNFHPLPGFEPPIIQPVAQRYTTELSRLLEDIIRFLITIFTKFLKFTLSTLQSFVFGLSF